MERRKNFYELTQSLSSGFFSDKVMMMLGRIGQTKTLLPKDEEILDLAYQFFDDVLTGYMWSDNPSFSKQTLKSANSFSKAVNAIVSISHTENFEEYIKKLKSIVNDIKRNNYSQEIELLDNFFFEYSKSELQRTDSLINKAPVSL